METKRKVGFASLPPSKLQEVVARAGRIAHRMGRAHEWEVGEKGASVAGKKGGEARGVRRRERAAGAPSCIKCRDLMFLNKNWKFVCLRSCWGEKIGRQKFQKKGKQHNE